MWAAADLELQCYGFLHCLAKHFCGVVFLKTQEVSTDMQLLRQNLVFLVYVNQLLILIRYTIIL
jgi:hypothetical protein